MPRERVAAVICQPCRQGADWITNTSDAPEDIDWSRVLHGRCVGPSQCDCQHKVMLQATGKSVRR